MMLTFIFYRAALTEKLKAKMLFLPDTRRQRFEDSPALESAVSCSKNPPPVSIHGLKPVALTLLFLEADFLLYRLRRKSRMV